MTGNNRDTIVFSTLAMNQTRFFAELGRAMTAKGYRVVYICFHERSYEYLRDLGLMAFNIYERADQVREELDPTNFGIENPNLLISHEKVTFGVRHTAMLLRKLRRFLAAIDLILEEVGANGSQRMTAVQELGGFISLLATYYAARSRGLDNVFIEPSFFRGRVLFIRNSFKALPIPFPGEIPISQEVEQYLDQTLKRRNIVIPKKDTHHYRSITDKLFDKRHIRRLFEKLYDKHILGKREEFSHIGGHVRRHLMMLVNKMRLNRFYRPIPREAPFIYYPLHVPNDAALTIRSPEYLDQYGLLDYVARTLPMGHKLVIKEHPALVGAIHYGRIRQLLCQHDNMVILHPTVNNFEVMSSADAVITVNSKSGAEALLLGKTVVVLGDAFYRSSRLVRRAEHLGQVPKIVREAVDNRKASLDPQDIQCYFQNVWNCSYPGELYHVEPGNISTFADSLVNYLRTCEVIE